MKPQKTSPDASSPIPGLSPRGNPCYIAALPTAGLIPTPGDHKALTIPARQTQPDCSALPHDQTTWFDLAALLATGAVGASRLPSAPVSQAARDLARSLGADVRDDGGTTLVSGPGLGGLREPADPLDLRRCPHLLAPLCGLLAGHPLAVVALAKAMPEGLIGLLNAIGAHADGPNDGAAPPLSLRGTADPLVPTPDDAAMSVEPPALALTRLFAGLVSPGETSAALPPALANPLADLFAALGAPVAVRLADARLRLTVTGAEELLPLHVSADWPHAPLWWLSRRGSGPPLTVAIDGPAAAGKGTLARAVAERLDLAYLDTGKIYRATGMAVIRAGGDPADPAAAEAAARALDPTTLADPALRGEEAGRAASVVAAIPAVRAALLDFQRAFAQRPPNGTRGAVLDGRDIGSVVCPDAPAKLFVTARPEIRAHRRFMELREAGQEVIESRILQDMKERDARDSSRGVAPLVPAPDAVVLDSSDLDRSAALDVALALIGDRLRTAPRVDADDRATLPDDS